MITKLDIMLDPDMFDGDYVGQVEKVTITDNSVQFAVAFDFNGRPEKIIAELSLTKSLNRTTAMLRESGVKRIDELKNAKQIGFSITRGWINITAIGDNIQSAGSTTDSSAFLK